jgi:hypothetical protein
LLFTLLFCLNLQIPPTTFLTFTFFSFYFWRLLKVKISTESKKQKFLKTEEEIEKKVNELRRILTKEAMEKLDKKEKVIERNGENITLEKK